MRNAEDAGYWMLDTRCLLSSLRLVPCALRLQYWMLAAGSERLWLGELLVIRFRFSTLGTLNFRHFSCWMLDSGGSEEEVLMAIVGV
ncbi:MAG: hypothetical protein ISS68_02065 [Desulfobacteraceae bacterium]|nr:hypothetical protein [Desulfobacteraceae bacterium]